MTLTFRVEGHHVKGFSVLVKYLKLHKFKSNLWKRKDKVVTRHGSEIKTSYRLFWEWGILIFKIKAEIWFVVIRCCNKWQFYYVMMVTYTASIRQVARCLFLQCRESRLLLREYYCNLLHLIMRQEADVNYCLEFWYHANYLAPYSFNHSMQHLTASVTIYCWHYCRLVTV